MGQMTIKYANPLGEFDTKYGQKYWGKAHDIDLDISFNLMNPVNFEDGDEIDFEEKVIKETSKGKEYLQLRKVKRSGAGEQSPSVPPQSPKLKEGLNTSPPATDLRGDAITASMAVKLAYVEFVRCEGQLPNDEQQWKVIEDNARNLMDMVGRVKLPQNTLKSKLAKGFGKVEELDEELE